MPNDLRKSNLDGPNASHAHSFKDELVGISLLLGVIWGLSCVGFFREDIRESLALIPRTLGGLNGIVTMPLVHGNFGHLLGNTVTLAVLLLLLAGSRARSWVIVSMIALVNGSLLWLLGGAGAHIGASGLVLGLITYLIFSGILERRPVPLLISAVVAMLYGPSLIWNLIPLSLQTSWTGHLFGAAAGVLAAWAFASKTDPSKTDPSKTDVSKTDVSKTDPSRTGPSKTALSRTGPFKTAPSASGSRPNNDRTV